MELNTKRFNDAYDWLLFQHLISGQSDFAESLKTSRPNITNMLNGKVRVTIDTMKKVHTAYPNIFNYSWIIGDPDVPMLIENEETKTKQTDIPEYIQMLVNTATSMIDTNRKLELKLARMIEQNEVLHEQLSFLLSTMGAQAIKERQQIVSEYVQPK